MSIKKIWTHKNLIKNPKKKIWTYKNVIKIQKKKGIVRDWCVRGGGTHH